MKIKNLIWLFCLVISKISLADCFDKAGIYYQIDPDYLRAIARQESNFNAKAKNKNKDGSLDLGIMQINSKTFNAIKNEYPTLTESDLINYPCLNIHIGAMILSRNFALYGKNWLAVGMYNAGIKNTNTSIKNRYHYARKIHQHYQKIKSGKMNENTIY
ncbi:lytic transglycosylase domain-containing protein (plasmid) [Candidatus Arsenophonus nilaparvatae]|uniref:lytic transglycosylase domain-containing protein n=1 Tax=Candidatus Arsenophonus nilaparvatae TaxID=1247023 RepID=UPI0037C05A2F